MTFFKIQAAVTISHQLGYCKQLNSPHIGKKFFWGDQVQGGGDGPPQGGGNALHSTVSPPAPLNWKQNVCKSVNMHGSNMCKMYTGFKVCLNSVSFVYKGPCLCKALCIIRQNRVKNVYSVYQGKSLSESDIYTVFIGPVNSVYARVRHVSSVYTIYFKTYV